MSSFYKQLEVKTNRTFFSCRNRNGHHNTKLDTTRKDTYYNNIKTNKMSNSDPTKNRG
jgi:hypothetical protein